MKRFLIVALLFVIAALLLFGLLRHQGKIESTAAEILPSDTALFVQIPDPIRNGQKWRQTDLYAISREPSVEEFLKKPKAEVSKHGQLNEIWRKVGLLRMRDVFVATTTFDSLRLVGGFEFRCDRKQAETIIEGWKSTLMQKAPGTERLRIEYQNHVLDVIKGRIEVVSTFVGSRFLAASTEEDLKSLLDHLDHRVKTPTLGAEENFSKAMKEMPSECAWLFYLQPRQLAQKLATLRAQVEHTITPNQQTILERVQSFSHATALEGAKIKDVDFVAMPQLYSGNLTRETLSIASADTLLYAASILNLQQQIDWAQQATKTDQANTVLHQFKNTLAAAGITSDDWKNAFGDELSLVVDWTANTRIPTGVATLAIKDAARANKIVRAVAGASGWRSTARDNIQYYSAPAEGNVLAISPTVALTDRLMICGLDQASVDKAIAPNNAAQPLATTERFKAAGKLVPEPRQMFVYVDLPTLYSRLDATLRPILLMSAAFVPKLNQEIDLTKLPTAEAVARHLSPTVTSQSYTGAGYRSESVGTITISQTMAVAALAWLGTVALKNNSGSILRDTPSPSPAVIQPSTTP